MRFTPSIFGKLLCFPGRFRTTARCLPALSQWAVVRNPHRSGLRKACRIATVERLELIRAGQLTWRVARAGI